MLPFRWTINPYRGCEFGCKYCYARYTHEFMELRDPEQFERKIFAKTFDAARFREELRALPLGETDRARDGDRSLSARGAALRGDAQDARGVRAASQACGSGSRPSPT